MNKVFQLKVLLSLCLIGSNVQQIKAQDSLKIFVIGEYFKGEQYRFQRKDKVLQIKTHKGKDLFSFWVPVPKNIEIDDRIDLKVYQRRRLLNTWRNSKVNIYYDPCREFCILLKSHKIKHKFAFEVYWSNEPHSYIGRSNFWSLEPGPLSDRFEIIYYWYHLNKNLRP
jgi:hypothetical protein